jgi:hypothetical protein
MTGFVRTDAQERLKQAAGRHPYPLIFATISGADLYGFPSPDWAPSSKPPSKPATCPKLPPLAPR